MPAAVVAVDLRQMDWPLVLAAQAAVVRDQRHQGLLLLREPQTQAVAVAVALEHREQVAQAAPASSFSNTTSALPQSLPSSPRRSGQHRLVR